MNTFLDIRVDEVAGAILIIDIDGTLTYDHGTKIETPIQERLREFTRVAEIYLCSNGSIERTREIAKAVGVRCIESAHRKPSRKTVETLHRGDKRIIVIGDKVLTDGILAQNIGATFIPVKHLRHSTDTIFVRATYIVDDIAGFFFYALLPIWPYVALLRPFQWIKNIIILCPAFFAGTLFYPQTLFYTLLAVFVFCTVASAAYVFNDLCDIEQDRLHPVKRYRPFPSGVISPWAGRWLLIGLLVLLAVELVLVPALVPVIAVYIVLNMLYSFYLKHTAVLDIALVASFYVLRIVAGGLVSTTYISPWIVLCVFFGALFIVVGKRRAEFARTEKRKVLSAYSQAALDAMLLVTTALVLASYGLYSILGSKASAGVYSTVFVLIVMFRLLNRMYVSQEIAEYPEQLIFRDRWVVGMVIAWIAYMSVLLY